MWKQSVTGLNPRSAQLGECIAAFHGIGAAGSKGRWTPLTGGE
jgi:hypothetical protein